MSECDGSNDIYAKIIRKRTESKFGICQFCGQLIQDGLATCWTCVKHRTDKKVRNI